MVSTLVSWLCTVTVALGTTAPERSVTSPVNRWPNSVHGIRITAASNIKAGKTDCIFSFVRSIVSSRLSGLLQSLGAFMTNCDNFDNFCRYRRSLPKCFAFVARRLGKRKAHAGQSANHSHRRHTSLGFFPALSWFLLTRCREVRSPFAGAASTGRLPRRLR